MGSLEKFALVCATITTITAVGVITMSMDDEKAPAPNWSVIMEYQGNAWAIDTDMSLDDCLGSLEKLPGWNVDGPAFSCERPSA